MPLKCKQCLFACNAASVIGNADQLLPTTFYVDADFCTPGIELIFDQFFHNRNRSFNNFSGSDFVDNFFREKRNFAHRM